MGFLDLRYQKTRRNREELLQHLKNFELEIKPSVGIWYVAPGGGRWHEPYTQPLTIPERIEVIAEMAKFGVKAVEAHYPTEANEEYLPLYQKLEQETGIKLIGLGPHSFYFRESEFGTLSNVYPDYQQKSYDLLVRCLKMVKSINGNTMGLWPGIDGYTYSFGHNYYDMWDRFEEALASAMDEVPGVQVSIEPKPYEPIPNNIYRTTADGLILTRDVERRLKNPENKKLLEEGHTLVGMQPEIGHVRMGFEDAPYVYSRVMRDGRLLHTHWNSQPMGNYDQDLNIGVVEFQQAEASLYALKMYGYRGYYGIDIYPERLPALKAVELNCRALNIMNERINALPHERLLECYFDPANHRGQLEEIYLESLHTC